METRTTLAIFAAVVVLTGAAYLLIFLFGGRSQPAMQTAYVGGIVPGTAYVPGTVVVPAPAAAPPSRTVVVAPQPQKGSADIGGALGQTATAYGIAVTPLAVVEDSRCPSGVQCIQAGRVRVHVRISSALGTREQVLSPGDTARTGNESVTLMNVSPYPAAGVPTSAADYRFVFRVVRE